MKANPYKRDKEGYEHRRAAEQMLGRPLFPGEVVHHEDRNKHNNSPENLMVFRSNQDHVNYHALPEDRILIKNEDGSYMCNPVMLRCRFCEEEYPLTKTADKTRCNKKDCVDKAQRKVIRPSREELLKRVWDTPALQLSKEWGVSDVSINRWCRRYGIKRPGRGYWTGRKRYE